MTDPRTRLEQMHAEARQRVATSRHELDAVIASAGSTTGDDEHDPEGATIGFERAQAMALLAHAEQRLAEIGMALERVGAGSYGICLSCGRPIGTPRLQARPSAGRCLACASQQR